MFGKKKSTPDEIDISSLSHLKGSEEFLRMWAANDAGGNVTCVIAPEKLGSDPFLFGIALVDCVRHGAKAWAYFAGISEKDALARIWEGLDAERTSPTDTPVELFGEGTQH